MDRSPRFDFMETLRVTHEWLGASVRSFGAMAPPQSPAAQWLEAWGAMTQHSFQRMAQKPDWNIAPLCEGGSVSHEVQIDICLEKDFGDLLRFHSADSRQNKPKVLLLAPMSGHYATMLRDMVKALVPHCDTYVTDWRNARDVPLRSGAFDIEEYIAYILDFIRYLGPETHVVAVCQPAPLALAATAYFAQYEPCNGPKTLTLMGGPVDPEAAPTQVSQFSQSLSISQFRQLSIQQVAPNHKGAGRPVYPGLMQLASFMAMNGETHARSFARQLQDRMAGRQSPTDRHNAFYDEYLCVMDLCADFYLSTVARIFQRREIARNCFSFKEQPIDLGQISNVPVFCIEGAQDDIAAPGQCSAALALCSGLAQDLKSRYLHPKAGHYGLFAGSAWRKDICPRLLEFMRSHA